MDVTTTMRKDIAKDMKTPEYHVGAGLFGIYAGTLMPPKEGKPTMWRNKSNVTDEAIGAVRDYMMSECLKEREGKTEGGYEWKRKDGKTVSLMIKVVESDAENA